MKFLTTKEATRFGIPSRIQASGFLLLLGVILMCWSLTLYFAVGARGRSMAILLGCLLVGIAALLRSGNRLSQHFMFIFWSVVYMTIIMGISKIQGHAEWLDPRSLIYSFTPFLIFIAGYLLGSERPAFNDSVTNKLLIAIAGACVLTQVLFFRSMQSMDLLARRSGGRGDFGSAEFNPIAVAFATGCLAAVFLGLAFTNRQLLQRIIFFGSFGVILLAMLSAASRGAAIWMFLSFALLVVMVRKQNYFSMKHKMLLLVIVVLAVVGMVVFYNFNSAIATRIDVLVNRLTGLMSILGESHLGKDVSSGRMDMWKHYLSSPGDWLPIGERHFSDYPHNLWLEALMRYGFFGLPLLILFLYIPLRLSIDIIRGTIPTDGEFVVITTLFFFAYLSNTTSLTFSANRAMFLGLGYLLGYYLSLKKRRLAPPVQMQQAMQQRGRAPRPQPMQPGMPPRPQHQAGQIPMPRPNR